MAKSKRRKAVGLKITPVKNYRDDAYVPYIFNVETGILKAWTTEPTLTDGDVRNTLRKLIKGMEKTQTLPNALLIDETTLTTEEETANLAVAKSELVEKLIIEHLKTLYEEKDPLSIEDLIGVLKVINNSIGSWNVGMHAQGYLKYIKNFLAEASKDKNL